MTKNRYQLFVSQHPLVDSFFIEVPFSLTADFDRSWGTSQQYAGDAVVARMLRDEWITDESGQKFRCSTVVSFHRIGI